MSLLLPLVWEQPQTLLGATNLLAHTLLHNVASMAWHRGRVMVRLHGHGAVSLGLFVFVSERDNPFVPVGPENVDHEWGHAQQSRAFGPLYLPLVGVPSALRAGWAVAHKILTGRRWKGYYDGWPERQADQLGGVDPSHRPPP